MKPETMLLFLMATSIATPLDDRNYYEEELQFTRTNWTFGNTGTLKTAWGTTLHENAWAYITENKRLKYVISENGITEIPPKTAKNYTKERAAYFAKGTADAVNRWMNYPIFQTKNQCALIEYPFISNEQTAKLTTEGLKTSMKNAIDGIHWRFPEIHITEAENGWCFDKP